MASIEERPMFDGSRKIDGGINIEGGVFLLHLVRYATTYLALTQERMAQFCLFGLSALGKHVLLLPEPTLSILR